MKVSVVRNNTDKNPKPDDLERVFQVIRNGSAYSELIEKIRTMASAGATKTELNAEKDKLPAILFNGTFKFRKNEGLIEGTGLMILDFDNVPDKFWQTLQENAYIYACWKSPSGTGYKALVKIPIVKSDAEFKTYYFAIMDEFPNNLDDKGKDVVRLCYLSEDFDLHINEKSETWTKQKFIKQPESQGVINTGDDFGKTNWNLIMLPYTMIVKSIVGNRHDTIRNAGRLIGGYIASCQLIESEVISPMETAIYRHCNDEPDIHIRGFLDGVANGKLAPLSKKEIMELSLEEKLGKVHVTLDEAKPKMRQIREHGRARGYKVGWKELDDNYTILLGSTTYLYSSPYSGKTQFWNECLVNLSIFYGLHHVIFSPETGDAAEVYIELCQIYAKKDYSGDFKMTALELEIAEAFVHQHFICLDPDSFDKTLNVQEICDYVTLLELHQKKTLHTLTIDPYNELKHPKSQHRDLTLEDELIYIRKSAKNNNRHICIVTHVTDQEGIYVKDKGYTYYPIPTFREIAGGQTWSRKGMMMLSVWRPIVMKKGTADTIVEVGNRVLKTNQLIIQIQKAKPKGYGRTAEINLYYEWQKHSFTDEYGFFAQHPEMKQIVVKSEVEQETPF